MAKALITESHLNNIADAIREKNGSSLTYTPGQMAAAIGALYPEPSGSIDITQNGTVDVKSKAIASVAVPNTYSASDEGKVISSGALVGQTSRSIVENGTYDTTTNNEVVVNVPSGGGSVLVPKTITQNGTYDPADDNADGYSGVTVNVQSGGGSDIPLINMDFTILNGMSFHQVNYGLTGAVFDSPSDYIRLPFGKPDTTIEVDIGQMQLTGSDHKRFIMATQDSGLIYRSTGKWAVYFGAWEETEETDPSFFANSTVRIYIDATNKWHIYKDGVLFFEPTRTRALNFEWYIGSEGGQSINGATIRALRVYNGEHTG